MASGGFEQLTKAVKFPLITGPHISVTLIGFINIFVKEWALSALYYKYCHYIRFFGILCQKYSDFINSMYVLMMIFFSVISFVIILPTTEYNKFWYRMAFRVNIFSRCFQYSKIAFFYINLSVFRMYVLSVCGVVRRFLRKLPNRHS